MRRVCQRLWVFVTLAVAVRDGYGVGELGQTPVTFDLDEMWEPIEFPEEDSPVGAREVSFETPKQAPPRSGLPRPGPRSFSGSHTPTLPFPPAFPSLENLQSICDYGNSRPRYPPESLPQTGFSYLRRQGDAINRMESWYNTCCHATETQDTAETLCCAQLAWKQALADFCADEFMVKTSHYHCCQKSDGRRWECFQKETPPDFSYILPTLAPVQENVTPALVAFSWNHEDCKNATKDEAVTDISFPPGRPTNSNIDMVCLMHKVRPRYSTKCLPGRDFSWLARQAKAVNRLEADLERCCKKKEVLTCAEDKWKKVLDRFCNDQILDKAPLYPCCEQQEKEGRYECFSGRAPFPDYAQELLQKEVVFDVCTMDLSSLPSSLKTVVNKCCELPESLRADCRQLKIKDLAHRMCSAYETIPDLPTRCCVTASQSPSDCLSSVMIESIVRAPESLPIKRDKCPLVSF